MGLIDFWEGFLFSVFANREYLKKGQKSRYAFLNVGFCFEGFIQPIAFFGNIKNIKVRYTSLLFSYFQLVAEYKNFSFMRTSDEENCQITESKTVCCVLTRKNYE